MTATIRKTLNVPFDEIKEILERKYNCTIIEMTLSGKAGAKCVLESE